MKVCSSSHSLHKNTLTLPLAVTEVFTLAQQSRTEQNRTEQDRVGQNRAGQQDKAGQSMTEQDKARQAGQDKAEQLYSR